MRSLVRALTLTGRPVPMPWSRLARYVRPRTQSVMVVLGASGVGKSTFALNWAAEVTVPTLYISLDTPLVDHAVRLLARRTGTPVGEIEAGHDEDLERWAATWRGPVEALDHQIRFCDLSIRASEVRELVEAETEYLGEPPALVVLDNTMNLLEAEESAGEYRRVVAEMVRVARETNTLVLLLHHLRRRPPRLWKGQDEDEAAQRVHLTDSLYAVDQEARYVLGLWRPAATVLRVAVLKNRMGPANMTGSLTVDLPVDMSRARIFADEYEWRMERYRRGEWNDGSN